MFKTIFGVLENRNDAAQAINKLEIEGFKAKDISIIMNDHATGAEIEQETGATMGTVTGGILGALTGFGLPKERAQVYEERIQTGAILLAIPAHESAEMTVKTILNDFKAQNITSLAVAEDRIRAGNSVILPEKYEETVDIFTYSEPSPNTYQVLGAKGGKAKKRMARNIRRRR